MWMVVASSDNADELTASSWLCSFTELLFRFILRLSPFLDSQQLVFPQPLEVARPFMQRPDCQGIHLVNHLPTLPADLYQANILQHFEMFGNGGLLHFHCVHNLVDGALLQGKEVQNFAPSGLSHGIECIRGGGGSCHVLNIFPYGNMSS